MVVKNGDNEAMTDTLKTAIDELQKHPEEVQESWGARILDALGATTAEEDHAGGEREPAEPYSSLDVLLAAKLPGRPDASVTYEDELYGPRRDEE